MLMIFCPFCYLYSLDLTLLVLFKEVQRKEVMNFYILSCSDVLISGSVCFMVGAYGLSNWGHRKANRIEFKKIEWRERFMLAFSIKLTW